MTADPVKKYLAAIGRKGGGRATEAQAQAARENGRKGGRPKKAAAKKASRRVAKS